MVYRWADVEYGGIIFNVEGDWENGEPYTENEPPGSAGFQEYDIMIDDKSILELLLPEVKDKLVEQAEEKLMEMDNE